MGMQTDVKSGFCFAAASTAVVTERTRLRGVTISYPSGGTVQVTNGNGGAVLFTFQAPATAGSVNVLIPGEGILASAGLYVTCAASTTANVFYG
jgi:hypothetical protein